MKKFLIATAIVLIISQLFKLPVVSAGVVVEIMPFLKIGAISKITNSKFVAISNINGIAGKDSYYSFNDSVFICSGDRVVVKAWSVPIGNEVYFELEYQASNNKNNHERLCPNGATFYLLYEEYYKYYKDEYLGSIFEFYMRPIE